MTYHPTFTVISQDNNTTVEPAMSSLPCDTGKVAF